MKVEIVRAWPDHFESDVIELADGATLGDAVRHSRWAEQIADEKPQFSVFGERVSRIDQHILEEGDRIEWLRPLIVDPKQARRKRAEVSKERKGGR